MVFMLSSCHKKIVNPNRDLTIETFSEWKTKGYGIKSHQITIYLSEIGSTDQDATWADYRTRMYYLSKGKFLWITRNGVNRCADSLLTFLKTVADMGFSLRKFRVQTIEDDLVHLRNLDVDTAKYEMNRLLARLEYNLTKAYLRYTVGQRFGFMNPMRVFNRLDVHEVDSLNKSFRGLYDIPMEIVGKEFLDVALRKIRNDSVPQFLHEIQPKNPLYTSLLNRLKQCHAKKERMKLLCNIERSRWRLYDYPWKHTKYVLVNIPSFHLRAVERDSVFEMKIGCGSFETKTPLLTSRIMRMDLNPQWVIPRSIIKKSIVNHAGDSAYFTSHRYYVRERKTIKHIPFSLVSRSMLNSSDYFVIQEGGEGNALGRIIFRFNNNFSVFLHYTSAPEVFAQSSRDVSHGCIRVEKPLDLAVFLLKNKDEKLIDKIRYSMTVDLDSRHDKGKKGRADRTSVDKRKLISSLKVEPEVPLFITYYTIYPNKYGQLETFPDVYGYDRVIYNYLENFIE